MATKASSSFSFHSDSLVSWFRMGFFAYDAPVLLHTRLLNNAVKVILRFVSN
jgi:hypothetical protein